MSIMHVCGAGSIPGRRPGLSHKTTPLDGDVAFSMVSEGFLLPIGTFYAVDVPYFERRLFMMLIAPERYPDPKRAWWLR